MRLKAVEIVGLHLGSHGRTCGYHSECGRIVRVATQVKFHSVEKVKELVTITEKAIKVMVVEEGIELCFLTPRPL
jgi:hypothetical protein